MMKLSHRVSLDPGQFQNTAVNRASALTAVITVAQFTSFPSLPSLVLHYGLGIIDETASTMASIIIGALRMSAGSLRPDIFRWFRKPFTFQKVALIGKSP